MKITTYLALAAIVALSLMGCGDDTRVQNRSDDTNPTPDATTDGGDAGATLEGPHGLVFAPHPNAAGEQPARVLLPPPTSSDGALTNEYTEVFNCLNDPNGEPFFFGDTAVGVNCTEAQTALPDAQGQYLIDPPLDSLDPDDVFSEVQMYFHVNQIHGYYHDQLGVTDLDFSLPAITNFQQFYNAEFVPPSGGWQPMDNAAFYFPEAFESLGLEPRPNGAIIFGQGSLVDFSYDSSVIYHEYTHAVIGADRLNGVLIADHGLDNFPAAISEGLADYFAASFLDDALVGPYGLAAFGENTARDLTQPRRCPDDLFAESHADGKIIGSAMWALRAELGAEVADGLVYRAMLTMSNESSIEAFGQAVLAEASMVSSEVGAQAEAVLDEYGIIGCNFSRPWTNFDVEQSEEGLPLSTPGLFQANSPVFTDWVPGYMQFNIEVPAGQSVTLSWETSLSFRGNVRDPLMVAVRKDAPVQLALLPTRLELIADAQLDVPYASEDPPTQVLTLSGDCIPEGGGVVHMLFLNPSRGPSRMLRTSFELIDDVTNAVNVETCVSEPAPAP